MSITTIDTPTETKSPSDVPELKEIMDGIRGKLQSERHNTRDIGKDLRNLELGLKEHSVKYGNWRALIETEFDLYYQKASNYMRYSEAADWAQSEGERKFKNFLKLPDTAVCKLWRAGKEEALNKALSRFDNVERVKLADAEEIAKNYKPGPTENTRPADTEGDDTEGEDAEGDDAQGDDTEGEDAEGDDAKGDDPGRAGFRQFDKVYWAGDEPSQNKLLEAIKREFGIRWTIEPKA